jgi:mRNA-degrading endonuclease toxin of MazEF toxin-antitoxin module
LFEAVFLSRPAPGSMPACPVQPPGPNRICVLVGVPVLVRRKGRPTRREPRCAGRCTDRSGTGTGPQPIWCSGGGPGPGPT